MKKKIIIPLAVLLLGALCVGTMSRSGSDANETVAETESAVLVEVIAAEKGDIAITVSETGVTTPENSVTISSEVSGRIMAMNIEVGEKVSKDQVLAEIDNELFQLAVDQAHAQEINTRAAFEKAEKDLGRYKILRERDEISEGEYETFRLQHDQAHSAFLSAEAAHKTAERQLRNATIKSPIKGEIAARFVDPGNMINIMEPIVKVVDNSTIKVSINISERDVVNVRTGMPVEINIDAFPGKSFQGTVFAVSPEADMNTHTFPVEVEVVNNQGPEIRSGMIARVHIRTGTINDAVLVPADAVIERYGKNYLYVASNGNAEEREVILGPKTDSKIQVVSGVQLGDAVITVGQFNVQDESPIEIKK